MRKVIPVLFFIFFAGQLNAQNFTGQWKGEFIDKSTSFTGWGGDHCEYVLELECSGTKVSGYSYTYFSDAGKRYYTICKLSGTLNKANKSIEVKEIERTKTNVPVTIRNCFQIHRLTYSQKEDEQSLEGSWVPVPNQEGDCGFGRTTLSRRVLKKNPAYLNNQATSNKTAVKPKTTTTAPPVTKTTPRQPLPSPVVKTQPKKTPPPEAKKPAKKTTEIPVAKADPEKKPDTKAPELTTNNLPVPPVPAKIKVPDELKPADLSYKKRNNELLKTIEIDSASFTVNLYDNGEIDGDSISLFFNGKLILSQKRLTDKAISLKLKVDKDREVNELIMFAENLGSIPPNTALMLVNDGENRYEVRISSDLQKSGVIRFIHKPKSKQ